MRNCGKTYDWSVSERERMREEREKLRALTMNEIVEGTCAERKRERERGCCILKESKEL